MSGYQGVKLPMGTDWQLLAAQRGIDCVQIASERGLALTENRYSINKKDAEIEVMEIKKDNDRDSIWIVIMIFPIQCDAAQNDLRLCFLRVLQEVATTG